uniref:Family with sequence similarity 184 member B n=1 Tax=Takifugu rubripes TaxID=31033 RepID=A0A674NVI8_TAKRU
MQPGIRPPRSLPLAATQNTMHLTPLAPPAGGEPTGRGSHVASSGCAMGRGPATRRSPNMPHPQAWLQEGTPVTRILGKGNLAPMLFFIMRGSWAMLCLIPHLGPVWHGWPYQGHIAPDNGAPRIIGTRKPLHHDKVCERLEEERRSREELRGGLEKEIEELRTNLRDATNEVCRLESVMKQRDRKEKVASEAVSSCGPKCSRLEDELQQSRSRLARIQEEAERQRDRQQREITSLRADKHRLEEKVLEQSRLNAERSLLDQNQRHTEEQMRAECEDRLRAEFRIEMNAAMAESEQRWQGKEQELQSQISELQSQLSRQQSQAEKKKAAQGDDGHGNPEIDRLRKEVQDTKEINKKLRELLQEPQNQSLSAERHNHTVALQVLERQAKEDVLSERNRLQTMLQLELDKQRAELTQQHTEWSKQMTQRHMKQIEDLQDQLQAHTQMMALQQDLKQQNQYQVFERQLDESRCSIMELQRENAALKKQLKENSNRIERSTENISDDPPQSAQKSQNLKEKEEESTELQKRDAQLEEEAQRLKEEVEKLRVEMEKLEESQKHWEERKEEEVKHEEVDENKRKENEEEERRRVEVEEIKREHKKEMQSLVSEYSSAQTHLQARIVALESELREREERCRRREPWSEEQQLGRLQERLSERDQLIKRLLEERHQLQLHPPVSGDNGTLRSRDSKSRPGSITPTMRRKQMDSPPGSSAATGVFLPHTTSTHQHSSSTLPHHSSSHPHTSPHYSTSSLPHKHTSLSLNQQYSPSILRSSRSRTSCTPLTPAPTAPLPVCPSSVTGIRYVSPSSHEPYAHLQAQSVRTPCLEQKGMEGLKQEWFTKYFSF